MKQNSINNNILKTTYIFGTLFFILVIYLIFFVAFQSEDIIDNSYNKRIDTLKNFTYKGNIYSADNEILAYTDKETEERVYPFNELMCHVIGYTGYGNTGLESAYNYEMLKSDINIFNKFSKEVSGKKTDGDSIKTTLSVELSKTCKYALSNFHGSIVVSDPVTGDIIAMESNPGFDINHIDTIIKDTANSEDGELLNRATQGLYTPGSTFKIFTLYEFMKENPNDIENYQFNCQGKLDFDDYSIHCSGYTWHGNEDLKSSFANSCNTSFVNLSKKINNDSLNKTCKELLFNDKLPLDIDYKSSEFSLTANDDEFIKNQTVIGQGKTLITPIHLNMITCAIANDGVLMKPRFVKSIVNCNDKVVKEYNSEEYKKLFKKEDSKKLKDYMRSVVLNGTAASLNNQSYTLYGKTGTAQLDEKGNVNSWFTCILEYDNKTYCITVVAENVNENYAPAKEITRQIINKLVWG